MKKYFFASCFALAAMLISGSTFAQENKEKENKEKEKKDKMGEYDEIIIKKKGDKDGKVTIEIQDGEVKVNGKSIEDYDDETISVRKRKASRVSVQSTSPSRFRTVDDFGQHGGSAWNYSSEAPMMAFSNSNRAFLGVSSEEEEGGAKIISVTENSAASKAGLKKGDVITKVGEHDVDNPSELTKAIGKFKPEDKVTVTYKRDGKENKATVTLGKNRSSSSFGYITPGAELAPLKGFNFDWDDNGHYFGNLRPRLGIKAQDTEEGKGVKVLEVADESLAEKAGIKKGDIITQFDGKAINSADELAGAAQDSREKSAVKVQVTRAGKAQTIEIKTPKKLKTANL